MANKQRGEATIKIGDTEHTICLTLGALATLEDALSVTTAGELDAIIQAPTYRQIVTMAHTLINFRQSAEVISVKEIMESELTWLDAWRGVLEGVKAANPAPVGAEGKGAKPEPAT